MKIYTRKGDNGKTSLARGTIVDKDDLRVEAYGTIDELNSYLGLLSSMVDDLSLVDIQRKLFLIGGFLSDEKAKSLILDSSCVLELENEIDKYSEDLEELHHFIIPNGCKAACFCHVCCTICRRAERRVVRCLKQEKKQGGSIAIQYLNRLSDYLFVLARFLNKKVGVSEIPV